MSNQLASRRFRSSSRPLSSGSRRPRSISSARRSTRNLNSFGKRVELSQQGDARRLQGFAQGALLGGALSRFGGLDQRLASTPDLVVIDIELAREKLQEALAAGRVERQIGAAEIGGASACRDAAGAPIQGAQHLLVKPARILTGKIGAGRPAKYPARGFCDFAPCAAQIRQRPVEHALEKAGGSGIGHSGSNPVMGTERDAKGCAASIQKYVGSTNVFRHSSRRCERANLAAPEQPRR